jgi:hypothetical protein
MTKITIDVNSTIHEKLILLAENNGVELEVLAAEFVEDMVRSASDDPEVAAYREYEGKHIPVA